MDRKQLRIVEELMDEILRDAAQEKRYAKRFPRSFRHQEHEALLNARWEALNALVQQAKKQPWHDAAKGGE